MAFNGQSNHWQQRGVPTYPSQQMYLPQQPPGFGSHFSSAAPAVPYTGLNPVAFQSQPAAHHHHQHHQQAVVSTAPAAAVASGGGGQSQMNSIGTVTKINADYGLVNNEVFFFRTSCKGQIPKLGDRVNYNATYSSSGQFKWNATHVQMLPSAQSAGHVAPPPPSQMAGKSSGGGGRTAAAYGAIPPSSQHLSHHRTGAAVITQPHRRYSPTPPAPRAGGDRYQRERERDRDRDRHEPREKNVRARERDEVDHDRKRRREDRSRERAPPATSATRSVGSGGAGGGKVRQDRDREWERERDRGRERERERPRERSRPTVVPPPVRPKNKTLVRSPARVVVPQGRAVRNIRRYMVEIPKMTLAYEQAEVQDLRQRYSTMYIPSDFFHAKMNWPRHFPPERPYGLRRRDCQFQIMHKMVEPIESSDAAVAQLLPPDANYLYSAKVMLLSCPPLNELYQKCLEEDAATDVASLEQQHHATATRAVHPSRLLGFLVGTCSRNEPMAIGGPWSPKLDGADPVGDPTVLIRTAIRTCKALTGIDLSNCTQWYRFVELHYHRQASSSSGGASSNNNNTTTTTTTTNGSAGGGDGAKEPEAESTASSNASDPTNNNSSTTANTATSSQPRTRIETVVIYLPDIHACMPSGDEWQRLKQQYKHKLDDVLARLAAAASAANSKAPAAETTAEAEAAAEAAAEQDDDDDDNDEEAPTAAGDDDDAPEGNEEDEHDADADENAAADDDNHAGNGAADEDETVDLTADGDDNANNIEKDLPEAADGDGEEQQEEEEDVAPAADAPSLTKDDLKSLTAQEIRDELTARNLFTQGPRRALVARLAKALDEEEKAAQLAEQEEAVAEGAEEEKPVIVLDDEPPIVDEAENAAQPEEPQEEAPEEEQVDENEDNAEMEHEPDAPEEQDDWTEGMDVDMNDIVILDEYDSRKNPEASEEVDKKEKTQLTRRYALHDEPRILVHPHATAKGGKFDCSVISLSELLDYRLEDTKERSFEVSLFAEIFNEMIMRDFAFNIYKELYVMATKAPAVRPNDEKSGGERQQEKSSDGADADVTAEETGSLENNGAAEPNGDKNVGKKSAAPTAAAAGANEKALKEQRDREAKERERNERENNNSSDRKLIVVKPHLLLSFVYFDATQCGYIFEKDLEDLFLIMGLGLSRAQARYIFSKVGTRRSLYYRKITHRAEELSTSPCLLDDAEQMTPEEIKRIAQGNRKWTSKAIKTAEEQAAAHDNEEQDGDADGDDDIVALGNADDAACADGEEGLVHYNGAVVHVGKLLGQMRRLERDFSDLDKLHNDFRKQHTELQRDHTRSSSKMKDLQAEVKSLTRKLNDASAELNSTNRKYRDQHATLSSIYHRIEPYFSREKEAKEKEAKDKEAKDKEAKEKVKESKESKDKHNTAKDKESKENETKEKDGKEPNAISVRDAKESQEGKKNQPKPKEHSANIKAKSPRAAAAKGATKTKKASAAKAGGKAGKPTEDVHADEQQATHSSEDDAEMADEDGNNAAAVGDAVQELVDDAA